MSQHKKRPLPEVWGSHYWFFLHSVAYYYPEYPNSTTKRKYYDLIQNLPLFIPNESIGNKLSEILDKYPVSPYLDNRESFMRWMNFIHNKVNYTLGKPEMGIAESIQTYESAYHQLPQLNESENATRATQLAFFTFLCLGIYYCYR